MVAVFTPQQGNVSLQQTEKTIENHRHSNCRVVEPSPNRYIYETLLHLRFRKQGRKRGGKIDCKSQEIGVCAKRFCLLAMSEMTSTKPHQNLIYKVKMAVQM